MKVAISKHGVYGYVSFDRLPSDFKIIHPTEDVVKKSIQLAGAGEGNDLSA